MAESDSPIISHWYQLIEGMKHSTKEFYVTLGNKIFSRDMAKVKTDTVEIAEGGMFSGKRLYFRVTRKEHIFDICAAPFGNGFFVSWWLSSKPTGCLATIPGVGWILRRFLKPITYYVIDTALMFQTAVHQAVLEALDEVTKEQGLRALSELERKPILHNIYGR